MKFTKIIKKTTSHYNGKVYDLWVDKVHNYNIDGLYVSNSGASSLVNFCLTITKLDPLTYSLIFERFLNPEREHLPDIDSDFGYGCVLNDDKTINQETKSDGGQYVFRYLSQKYGKDYTCNIQTFGSLETKNVIKDVSKAFDVPFAEVNDFTKTISQYFDDKESSVQKILDDPELSKHPFVINHQEIFKHCLRLEGNKKSIGQHAAGIVVSPIPLYNAFPLYKGKPIELPNEEKFDMYGSAYEKDEVEDMGFLKLDILKLKTVTILDEIQQEIFHLYGKKIEFFEDIPFDDKETWHIFETGQTRGIFQFSTDVAIPIIKKMKVSNLEECFAANSFIRPGTIGLDDYVKNKQHIKNEKDIERQTFYNDPRLDNCLKQTYGAIVFQEQLMTLISELMGISFGKADLYRRALEKPNKKGNKEKVQYFNDNVVDLAVKRGFKKETAEKLKNNIIKNSGYLFNKCISGREKFYNFKYTIEEMYKIKNDINYAKSINCLYLNEIYNKKGYGETLSLYNDKTLKNNIIKNIKFAGNRKTYKITLENNNTISCTINHKFPVVINNKFDIKELKELKVGNKLFINKGLSKIKIIKYDCIENVYDVEMENNPHNYLTNNEIITCNSHAACYSVISYFTAYFKVHYPLIFYKVMLNNNIDKFGEYMNLAKQKGIKILKPNVSCSNWEVKIEKISDSDNEFEKYGLRIGFNCIKGLGKKTIQQVINNQPYDSINQFFEKCNVNKTSKEALINAGVFNNMPININVDDELKNILKEYFILKDNLIYLNNKQLQVWFNLYQKYKDPPVIHNYEFNINDIKNKYIDKYELIEENNIVIIPETMINDMELNIKNGIKTRKRPKGLLKELLANNKPNKDNLLSEPFIRDYKLISLQKENKLETYIHEMQVNGFAFSEHPLNKYKDKIIDFEKAKDNSFVLSVGIIINIIKKSTKKGKPFYYITLLTPNGNIRLLIWDNLYKKNKNIINQSFNTIAIKGIKNFGSLVVENIKQIGK